MYISVYEDEKIGYIPTFEHITLTSRLETLYAQFEEFKNVVTLVEDVDSWYNTIK